MTPLQRKFQDWLKAFCGTCVAHGGTQVGFGCVEVFEFQTNYGILSASVHESDYRGQKKFGIVSIYLRFRTHDTGRVNDTLFGRDFNGWSGKWNITQSCGDLDEARRLALRELATRLTHVGCVPKPDDENAQGILRALTTNQPKEI